MNRIDHIKQTLFQNLNDTKNHSNVEFVLLDYNSEDGLEDWVINNLHSFISSKRLVYYRTTDPETFNHSHSKNLAFKLANGDILCNVNADHYIGGGFVEFVEQEFKKNDNIALTTIDFYRTQKDYLPNKDVFGKVCVKKSDFLKIDGFDEHMIGYGFEDWDFINRLGLIGVKPVFIKKSCFLKFISHGEERRYSLNLSNLYGLYVKHIKPWESEVIYLYNDHTLEFGTILDNSTLCANKYKYAYDRPPYRFEFSLRENTWIMGSWNEEKCGKIDVYFSDKLCFEYLKQKRHSIEIMKQLGEKSFYFKVTKSALLSDLILFRYSINNRYIMEKNLKENKIVVNLGNYGHANILKNFHTTPYFI